ncbi:MAG: RecQ family ATP-dependent DNA helicase, partial [Chitinophagales bacterium]
MGKKIVTEPIKERSAKKKSAKEKAATTKPDVKENGTPKELKSSKEINAEELIAKVSGNGSKTSHAVPPTPLNGKLSLRSSLNEFFGFDAFKGEQERVIQSLMSGHDTFVIMPTGGGKSLCYQLPALISEGTAIIISPLIALMKNQVDAIRGYSNKDTVAHFLNSSLTKAQQKLVKKDLMKGETKMLYVAPETLTKQENIDFLKELQISFVAVDEAHCISEWGHDFRPEYRKIKGMVEEMGNRIPIMALTATATPKVQSDILKNLGMDDPNVFIASFNRSNLYYEVKPKTKKDAALRDIVKFIKSKSGKS